MSAFRSKSHLCRAWLLATAFCAGWLLVLGVARAAEPRPWAGLTLEQALHRLQEQGLLIVFTSGLVRPEMRVEREPTATSPRLLLDEILAPHGLAARDSVGGRIVIVAVPPPVVSAGNGPSTPSSPLPTTFDEIDVSSPRPWILGEGISAVSIAGEDLLSLPAAGEDALRRVSLLPGTTSNDASARFSVRGGREDEVMVRLDGLEILEPFHLKDLNQPLSIFPAAALDRIDLYTGGFSAEYGDRMSGVLDVTTVTPRERRRTELGLSVLDAHVGSSGTWGDGRGSWLASLRGGSLELPYRLADENENPRFLDALGKLELQLTPRHGLRANLLSSLDELDFSETETRRGTEVTERFQTRYPNTYLWLTHQTIFRSRFYLDTRASWTQLRRDRRGSETSLPSELEVHDDRQVDFWGLAQDWSLGLSGRQTLRWGLDLRRLAADYRYASRRSPGVARSFDQRFTGEQIAGYVTDRLDLGDRWVLDLGLRFDENTLTDAERVSPRLGAAVRLDENTWLRAAGGHYSQSQRLYELQVEDGETRFAKDELAEHAALGLEKVLARDGSFARRPLTLRAELYRRRIRNPKVRFENLFDPVGLTPELEDDRVRIAPESSVAQGLEVFLGGAGGARLDWFVSYTYARTRDHADGRTVPRSSDQPHSLVADLTWRAPWKWDLGLAARYHTGWPTTAVFVAAVEQPDGSIVFEPVIGPRAAARLPDYFRLDLRLARRFRLERGELLLTIDVQNLTNTRNVRGYDISFEPTSGGGLEAVREPKHWAGLVPTLGLSWRF